MIKRFTLLLLLLPAFAIAQTPITPSWTRQTTQISILDTIGMSYSGQITKQYFAGTAWTRRYMINKADTDTFSATRYWVEHLTHVWYADQTLHGTLNIPDFNTGVTFGSNSIVRTTDQLSINLGDRNGLAINYFGTQIARFSSAGHSADQGYISIDAKLSLENMVDLTPYGSNVELVGRVSSAGGGDEGLIGKIPTSTFATPTQLDLKQPRIISALPTQTTTRPLVGDSVNQAIAKEIFRGDSLAAAISLKLNKTDTTTAFANLAHQFTANTFTGKQTIQRTTEQLRLGYDGSNYAPFTVSSIGQLTIAPTGGQANITGNLAISGNLQAGGSNSNFFLPAGQNYVSSSAAQFNYTLGGSTNFLRVGYYGSQNTALTANANYSMAVFGNAPVTTAATGTHLILSQVLVKAIGTVTSGGAAVTNTSTFTIEGSSSAGTNNYSQWVQAGTARFDGNVLLNGSGSTAVTQSAGDNSTKIATTAFVQTTMQDVVNTATDANYTITSANQLVKLPVVTANRTVSIPTASTYTGRILRIWNQNTSGTFSWSFTGATVKDAANNTLTNLVNTSVYILESDGSNWLKIN